MPDSRKNLFVGMDVGTRGARAGVFDAAGNMKGSASAPIEMWKPATNYVEQSSDDIWSRCCEVVRTAVAKAGILQIPWRGLGFDATCSLVDWASMRFCNMSEASVYTHGAYSEAKKEAESEGVSIFDLR
jgi:ribulose kinase